MKLISYKAAGQHRFGLVNDKGVVDLVDRLGLPSLKALLENDTLSDAAGFASAPADHRLEDIEFLPVIPDPQHVWCLAINYQEHIDEVANVGIKRDTPRYPALFMRYADTLVGHKQPLVKPKSSDQFDYEAELAVIIGKGGRHIAETAAMSHVAGYSAFNDGSARDWQYHTGQIAPGKNFQNSASLGPWLVTADEIANPADLAISFRLNGATLQDSRTKFMIHNIPKFVSYVSTMLELKPGDVLATGTPSGVGFSRKPPIYMKGGDTAEVEIECIGILSNPITAE